MNEQKNNGRGVFYGVIGVATLVVAIIGATFAYFTATASNNATITGNMATINFGLVVDQVTSADDTIGMIPMSNSMVHAAVTNESKKGICKDNNGNVVCQVYRATVTNTGSAALYLDGYVSLYGGSGAPTDKGSAAVNNKTTMRWAQVLCDGDEDNEVDTCTTIGTSPTKAGLAISPAAQEPSGITTAWATLASADQGNVVDSHNANNVLLTGATVTAKGSLAGSNYDIINRNYIRISDHAEGDPTYDREDDVTSALVFNQPLASANASDTDVAKLYFVVWLSETGTNQTADSDGTDAFQSTDAGKGVNFFRGDVVFNSAQGSEVTATFAGFATVQSDAV